MSVKKQQGRRRNNYSKIFFFKYLFSKIQQSSKFSELDETNLYTH